MADIVTALEAIDDEEYAGDDRDDEGDPREARALARTLRKMIYGSLRRTDTCTALGQAFNGATTVDWSFESDVVCIDLTAPRRAGDVNLDLYYAQAIGTI